jgi:OmpA-OmpF porin, OOP family
LPIDFNLKYPNNFFNLEALKTTTMKIILTLVLFAFLSSNFAYSQIDIGGKIKNKVNQRANKKADDTIDKTLDGVEGKNKDPQSKTGSSPSVEEGTGNTTAVEATSEKGDASIKSYSKFDFVPGDKVLYFEDFSQDAIGDFPDKWNTNSTGEIVTLNKFEGKWLKTSTYGFFIPGFNKTLPDNYTVEFDLVVSTDNDHYMGHANIIFSDDEKQDVSYGQSGKGGFTFNANAHDWDVNAYIPGQGGMISGKSEEKKLGDYQGKKLHLAFHMQKQRVRLYVDETKVFDLPRLIPEGIKINTLKFEPFPDRDRNNHWYFSNIRIAEGSPDLRNKLITEGKFVTHGITFDVNSDKLKPESFGVIREIGNVLKENPDMRIHIIGHTDSDGKAETNLDLSKRRAQAVKTMLENDFGITANRMEIDGKGASAPLGPNTTAEGKANNRRVEFVKL